MFIFSLINFGMSFVSSVLSFLVRPFLYILRTLLYIAISNLIVLLLIELVYKILRTNKNRKIMRTLRGKWAIVTGCTDGIGLGMVKELAESGINLVLISRSLEKLRNLEKDLKKHVSIRVVQVDFEESVDFSNALKEIKGLKPYLLINNVGVNESGPTAFMEHTEKSTNRILQVNIINTLKITQEYLSWDQPPSEQKYVLTTGSMLGSIPSPFQQIYAGSKAFVQIWSESLSTEIKNYHFEVFMTGLVCSKLSGAKKPNILTPSSDVYGRLCVKSFGFTSLTYPYFSHYILSLVSVFITRALIAQGLNRVGKKVRSIRERKNRTE